MPTLSPEVTPPPVSLGQALLYWLKLGFISFGGPAGQIALMHTELVERRRWISEARFLHALNYCMLLPGPEATQLAIYIGWLMHRTLGGIMAGLLFVLPSLLLLCGLSWVYLVYGDVPFIAGLLYGIKPAVVAIVLAAAWRIGTRSLKNHWLIGIALAAFVAIALLKLPFPAVVLGAAVLGALGGRFLPRHFHPGGAHASAVKSYGVAIIDDVTPPPAHAQFSWRKFTVVLLVGAGLGVISWGGLAWHTGVDSAIAQMGLFFTKAAMLTFGGAYAVLQYVYQGAVEHYHWLTPQQMIDGLALGETTPGPLIMIVAFVGFVGGWGAAVGDPLSNAIAAACVATFFTFLPSFIFILVGAPLIEGTRDNIRMTAPLTAISAAVVGVIVSLALFFAEHIFHLRESPGAWDWSAIVLTGLACVALFRFKVGAIPVIAACAMAGLVVSSLG